MGSKIKQNGSSNGNGKSTAVEQIEVEEVQINEEQLLKAKLETLETEYDALRKEAAALKAEKDALKELQRQENPVLSLEKRIQKVEDLTIVIEKWRKLNEAKTNVNGFKLGNDGLSVSLTLQDASGKTFKTSHNVVVSSVLDSLQKVMQEKIAEVEKQINFMD